MILNTISPSIAPPLALDMLVRWEPQGASRAAFYSGLDMACGTVRVMGAGIWREADADLYFTQQRRIIEEARTRFGAVKVFFDVRDWVVENPQSAIQFQDMNSEIYHADDRLAAVVTSSVSKQHPRTALTVGQREVFVSMNAAETWLQAYSITARTG
jgi:hypothetical protein